MPAPAPLFDTPRLTVRPFSADDYDDLYALRADEAVARYLGGTADLASKVAARLQYYLDHHARHGYAMSRVSLRGTTAMIGWGGLQHLDDGEEIEVGYALARAWWGRGLATELARAWLQRGFHALGFERIVAVADPENAASRHVMEKLGMRYEKRIAHYGMDTVYYAVSRAGFVETLPAAAR